MDNNRKPIYGDSFWYATKVWLTGVVAPPLLLSVFTLFADFGWVIAFLFIGGFCSIPSWLLLSWAAHVVRQQPTSELGQKAILAVVATLLTFLPFLLLSGSGGFGSMILEALAYALPVCLGVFFYSFQESTAPPSTLSEEANEIPD